ncbi:MAG: hypothetical protein SFX73_01810 [Kofleriaceae bacterium]|nr:hypothetical protein [Kofleriaceae bacterium]
MTSSKWVVATLVAVLGCKSGGAPPGTATTATATPAKIQATEAPVAPSGDESPAVWLVSAEKNVWELEGLLLAEAEAVLRTPAAKQALGELRFSDDAEARARAYLRANRSPAVREKAKQFVLSTNQVTRTMLAHVASQANTTPEDVFMDYLTYDALFDLAIMRYGYKRWKAGANKAIGDDFFSLTPLAPSASAGIKVISADKTGVEINVFGGHVVSKVKSAAIKDVPGVGKVGVVELSSTYEQLRAGMRGLEETAHVEELEWNLGYRVSFADELDEYLTWNATNPWAAVLYAVPANDVADMYAGAAAAAGFQTSTVKLEPGAKLPSSGILGTAERGLTVTVKNVQKRARLAATTPRRGHFVLVTVEVASSLKEDMKAPSEWFKLATVSSEYPELGVARPGVAAAVLPSAPAGAKLLQIPFTPLPKGAKSTLVLVYDVPSDLKNAALVVGSNELALDVAL